MKKYSVVLLAILCLASVCGITYKKMNNKKEYEETKVDVILTLEDSLQENSLWCGTFNLVWNDLLENIVKQEVVFTPQMESVEKLNKKTFTIENLKENSYVKKIGHPTYALKQEIEKEIKEKFHETSAILNDFSWEEENNEDYFLYAMLKKDFSFPKKFTKLEKGKFHDTKDVDYFGIDGSSDSSLYEQVKILYYYGENDFGVKLVTKEEEEIILSRGKNQNTFKEIYAEIKKSTEQYEGNQSFTKGDTLKIPYLNFSFKKEFTELENKPFALSNGDYYYIAKALQTISFELNESGGKIKSEAGMLTKNSASMEVKARALHFNEPFVLFLKEKESPLPFFAMKIDDIRKFA